MRYINYSLFLVVILLNVGSSLAMQPSGEEKRKKDEAEKIDKCMAKLKTLPEGGFVSAEFVKKASFDAGNNFQIGEIVITPDLNYKKYHYSCVTSLSYDTHSNPPRFRIGVKRNYPSYDYSVGFAVGDVGKLKEQPPVESLKQLNVSKIVDLIKTGKMNYSDIKPPKLPQELFDQVIEGVIKAFQKSK